MTSIQFESTQISVAVIIPVFNRAHFIRTAVESAINQTMRPAQVIVVDDGSTDNPESRLAGLPVTLVRQPNQGVAVARNTGLRVARAEWVAVLDSDDWLEPQFIERCVDEAVSNGAGLVSAGVFLVHEPGGSRSVDCRRRSLPPTQRKQLRALLFENLVSSPSVIRRDVLERVGGWSESRRLVGAEDWDLVIKCVHSGATVARVDEPLANRRIHKGQLSGDRPAAIRARIEVLETIQDEVDGAAVRRACSSSIRRNRATLNALRAQRSLQLAVARGTNARLNAAWWVLQRPLNPRRRLVLAAVACLPSYVGRRLLKRVIRR